MTVVAVISDTHLPRGSRRLPAECVERIRAADALLHAGDFVSAAFLEELRGFGRPVAGVHGNMDDAELRERLPGHVVVELGGARIGMTHDAGPQAGRAQRLVSRFPGCDAVVYGHTHVPHVGREGGMWVLNPGSPTERRRAPARSMLMLDVADGSIRPEVVELAP